MFVLRALNHSRRDFLPSYVGLRMLLSGTDKSKHADILSSSVVHRSTFAKSQKFFEYQVFKNVSAAGEIRYRTCHYPSPSSLLVEAYALQKMGLDGAFRTDPNVFSYLWPKPRSGHAFKYFYEGYRDRHLAVQGRLQDYGKDYVVVTADITSFYPSIDKGGAIIALRRRLGESGMPSIDKAVIDFAARQLIGVDVPGLPIGPPLSHALANICLDESDRTLFGYFGANYFRYVDDIAVVTHKSHSDDVLSTLRTVLMDHGYSINEDKVDTPTSSDWNLLVDEDDEEASFSTLRQMLTEMATYNPQGLSVLRERLVNAGFNLPISHLLRVSNGIKWRGYLRNLVRLGRQKLSVSYSYGGENYIFDYAMRLREGYARNLIKKSDFNYTEGDKRSQSKLRSLLRHIHCMMYMYNPSQLGFLLPCLPEVAECANTIAILNAAIHGIPEYILPFPGKTTGAFSQLWSERMGVMDFTKQYSDLTLPEMHSLSSLGLSGVVDLRREQIGPNVSDAMAGMLEFCSKNNQNRRERFDLDYIDEALTLKINNDAEAMSQILKSRFDSGEDFILEGLYVDQRSFS